MANIEKALQAQEALLNYDERLLGEPEDVDEVVAGLLCDLLHFLALETGELPGSRLKRLAERGARKFMNELQAEIVSSNDAVRLSRAAEGEES